MLVNCRKFNTLEKRTIKKLIINKIYTVKFEP